MTSGAELAIVFTGKDQGASKVIDDLSTKASGFGKVMGDVGKIAGGFLAANVIQGGAEKITGFFNDSIAAQRESIAVGAQLQAVLTSTGGAAGVTAQQAKDLASSIEKNSKFEDEAVLSGENLLLTFTGIGKDVFPQATQAMVDMSQALGQDMKSSAIQLGKALNDPTQGMTALRRVGVSFTEDQQKQIKALQASGDVMGAQKLILAELSKEFGGSAKAASDADAANEKYKDRMHDLQEQIGAGLIPIQDKLKEGEAAAIGFISSKVLPVLEDFSKYIKFVVTDGDTMNDWLSHMPKFLQPVAEKIGDLVVWFKDKFIPAMKDVVDFVSDHWPLISKVIEFGVDFVKTKIEGFIQTVKGIIDVVTGVVDLVQDLFHGRWSQAWDDMKQIAGGVVDILIGNIKEQFGNLPGILLGLVEDVGNAALKLGRSIVDGIENALKDFTIHFKIGGEDLGPLGHLPSLDESFHPFSFLAKGAQNFPGGWAVVGENGPELLNLPGGSNVFSNGDSRAMVGAGGGGTSVRQGDIHVHLENSTIYGVNDLQRTIVETVRDAMNGGGFRGVIQPWIDLSHMGRI